MAKLVMKIIPKLDEEWKPKKNPNIFIRSESDGIIMVSDKKNIFPIVLNKISARILFLCNGKRNVNEIISKITEEFIGYTSELEVREDVKACLARLKFLKFII